MLLDFNYLKEKYNMDIKGVLHIGAHYGQEFQTYVDNKIGNLMFFEPVPSTFEILKQNLFGKAILVNNALGNENKKIQMNIETANNGQSSSILTPNIHLQQYPHIQFNSTIEVDMVRLDDYMDEYYSLGHFGEPTSYNLINIDVQGYELEVFKGAEKFLNQIDYIITEVNRDEVYKDCAKIDELDAFLAPYGFNRVETTWDGITWGDAFYIKTKSNG